MSGVALTRHATLEAVGVEVYASIDGQGKPSYATSVDVNMRVLRQTKVVIDTDGSKLRTDLTAWIPNTETVQPDERDRITYLSVTFIVVAVKEVKDLNNVVVHRRIRCRRA